MHLRENINERLKEGIRDSACCIFMLNAYSVASTWCIAEVGAFSGANKKIIMYPTEPRCEVPRFLAGIKSATNPTEVVKACKEVIKSASPLTTEGLFYEEFHRSGLKAAFRVPVDNPARDKRISEAVAEECNLDGQKRFRLAVSSRF